MRWTVRLEARTDTGEVETTELVTIGRPVVGGTLAELGLALSEAKSVLAKLQASMVQSQVADYAACHRVCPQCRAPQPLKDRRGPPSADLTWGVFSSRGHHRLLGRSPV